MNKISYWANYKLFIFAGLLQLVGFVCMAVDPVENGFGALTLWIAPPVLLSGFLLPFLAFLNGGALMSIRSKVVGHPIRSFGAFFVLSISLVTYLITLEPTASLWDCSEFIAAAYKIQVPHTPGTPLTLLLGRIFSMMALGDVIKVAWAVNLMSATFSALTVVVIYFLTWHFGRKFTSTPVILLFGSLGAGLCLTFSDTFWYSAVEAETYGPSSFFMILIIWLGVTAGPLKGVERESRLLLICYLTGLSYCIHPMCILVFPIVPLVWSMEEGKLNWKKVFFALLVGVAVVLFISRILAVGLFEWAFKLDLFLVNQLGFPYYSGVFLLLLLIVGSIYLIWKRWLKTRIYLLSMILLVAGLTPYLILFIRSAHQPSINEFSPNNLAMIKPYMNRESYPGRPLLYGPYYDADLSRVSKEAKSYYKSENHYVHKGNIPDYHYQKSRSTILPRIYSHDAGHIAVYKDWAGIREGEQPRFIHNLIFMFRYQLGHMYGRYFLWNFAGREGDEQHSTWLLPWKVLVGRGQLGYNRATNQLFMIPLLFGLIGLHGQRRKDPKGFIINLTFFLITGLLLAVYLNATPNEPRERDYIYVGSYIAFSIWIGLGLIVGSKVLKNSRQQTGALVILSLCIPTWMAYQNWDDHDRSNRTFQIDNARNVLSSCEQNSILFTGGDNDTFPLWYLQEVEGFRTDVRVMVLSYFNADWYINQLTRTYYDSPPFNLALTKDDDQYGPYDPLYIYESMKTPIRWGKYMEALIDRNPQLLRKAISGDEYFIIPSRVISLTTSHGSMEVSIRESYLPKSEMAILDLVQSNDWSRPIYFNFTSLNSLGINLKPYLVQEGLVYRLDAHRHSSNEVSLDRDKMYLNLIGKGDYGNLSNEHIYFNHEDYQLRIIAPLKQIFNLMAESYMSSADIEKAKEVVEFALEKFYFEHLEPTYADMGMVHLLQQFGLDVEARELGLKCFEYFYAKADKELQNGKSINKINLYMLQESARFLNDHEMNIRFERLLKQVVK